MGLITGYRRYKLRKQKIESEKKYLINNSYPELTEAEVRQVQETWPSMHLKKKDLTWLRIYKKEFGFSPYMVGVWQTQLLREALNPSLELAAFENKALCDIYLPGIPFPETYVRKIKGEYYDAGMNSLAEEDAITLLSSKETFFIKPALGTMQGMGVEKVRLTGDETERKTMVVDSFRRQKGDFITQEVILQHPDMASLNPTSLNCCRVTTLYMAGKFGYSTTMKIGRKGADIDNWRCSYLCGVSSDGVLLGHGFDYELKRIEETDTGIQLRGIRLPYFQEMVHLVEMAHKNYFPNCGAIGWDVVVDDHGRIRVLEANLTRPGFVGEQLTSGTFFEPFCEEINRRIDRLKR